MPPPDARIWVGAGMPGRDHQVQPVAQPEGDALEHGPGQVAPVVAQRQPDERAAGQRVRVRAALAGQVGQEQQAVAAGRHVRRRGDEVPELDARARAASRNQRRLPAADSITDIRCQRSGHRVAERVDPTPRLEERAVGRREHDARRAERQRHRARRRRRPTPTALAAWSPPPATTGVPARSPVAAAAAARDRAGDLRALERRRQPGGAGFGARPGPRRTSRARRGRTGACPAPSALSSACSPVSRSRR